MGMRPHTLLSKWEQLSESISTAVHGCVQQHHILLAGDLTYTCAECLHALSTLIQYLSVLIRSRVQGPCVTSKSTVSASALGLAIYAAAHALLEENLSPPRLASTRLPAGMYSVGVQLYGSGVGEVYTSR